MFFFVICLIYFDTDFTVVFYVKFSINSIFIRSHLHVVFCFMFLMLRAITHNVILQLENFGFIVFFKPNKFQKNGVYGTWIPLITSYLIHFMIMSNSLDNFEKYMEENKYLFF